MTKTEKARARSFCDWLRRHAAPAPAPFVFDYGAAQWPLFLFDCGEGTQVSLRRQGLRWKNISHMFISHIHADHVTGIPGMMMLSSQVEREQPLHIFAPKGVCRFVSVICEALHIHINYPLHLQPIEFVQKQQLLYEDAELQISCFPLLHSQPTVGWLIEEKPRPGIFSPERASAAGVPKGPLWGALQRGEIVKMRTGKLCTRSRSWVRRAPARDWLL